MSTKRSIVKKEVRAFIESELEAGKTKSEIFTELSARYFDSKTLAHYVASVPDPVLRERYNTANTILFVLLIVTAIIKIVSAGMFLGNRTPVLLVLLIFVPLINIWLAVEVKNRRGYIYWTVVTLAFMGLLHSLTNIAVHGAWALAEIILLISIIGLSLYVGTKMFPKLRFGLPVKDAQGSYQF